MPFAVWTSQTKVEDLEACDVDAFGQLVEDLCDLLYTLRRVHSVCQITGKLAGRS